MAAATGFDGSRGFATWSLHKQQWLQELSALIPLDVQLEHYAGVRTPTVRRGIMESSEVAYRKNGARGAYARHDNSARS